MNIHTLMWRAFAARVFFPRGAGRRLDPSAIWVGKAQDDKEHARAVA